METYYELLEISNTASEEVIRASYKAKVKHWHPDNFSGKQEKDKATRIMQELNEALDTLTNSEKRREYDERIKNSGGNNQRNHAFEKEQEDEEELAEILNLVQKMIVLTKNEAEYLQLHRQIRQSSYSAREKGLMADALDYLTSERLKEEIEHADSVAYLKKEVSEQRSGVVWIVIIGFILSNWFASAWWIAIIIAVLGYIGGSDERKELKAAERAEAHISQYRYNGFRV